MIIKSAANYYQEELQQSRCEPSMNYCISANSSSCFPSQLLKIHGTMFSTLSLTWYLILTRNRKVMFQKSGHDNIMLLILIYSNRENLTHWGLVISTYLWFCYKVPREVLCFCFDISCHPTTSLNRLWVRGKDHLSTNHCPRFPSHVRPSKRIAWNPFFSQGLENT